MPDTPEPIPPTSDALPSPPSSTGATDPILEEPGKNTPPNMTDQTPAVTTRMFARRSLFFLYIRNVRRRGANLSLTLLLLCIYLVDEPTGPGQSHPVVTAGSSQQGTQADQRICFTFFIGS